jgi:acetyl esterase/lipase
MPYRLPFLLAAWLLPAAFVSAQPATRPALPKGVRAEYDVAYVQDGSPAQRLDLFLPERQGEKPLPLVVWVHGGGWSAGTKTGGPAAWYATKGYVTASVEYRFSQEALFPAQVQDCQAAIRWLRANAARYGIDPDRIGVWGASAGGHLVSLLGTAGGSGAFAPVGQYPGVSDRVQAVVDQCGPADFATVKSQAADDPVVRHYAFDFNDFKNPYATLIGARLGTAADKERAVSPVTYVTPDDPPFLLLHGTADRLVPFAQSRQFAARLRAAGVSALLQPLPGTGHGGGGFLLKPVQGLTEAFFAKHLKGAAVSVDVLPDAATTQPGA